MKIETKFDVGEEVYFILENKVFSSKVEEIHTQTETKYANHDSISQTIIFYKLSKNSDQQNNRYYEHRLYSSREELAQAILEGEI